MRTLRWALVQSVWHLYKNKEVGQSPQPMCSDNECSATSYLCEGLEETQNYRE